MGLHHVMQVHGFFVVTDQHRKGCLFVGKHGHIEVFAPLLKLLGVEGAYGELLGAFPLLGGCWFRHQAQFEK